MGSKTILNYELAEKIGSGGMGVVWRAVDQRLGREVALKFLSEGAILDAFARQRFLREARTAGSLNHPNIVTIYETNTFEDRPFIVMELVRGQSLAAILKQGRLDCAQAIEYAAQVCDGLGAAHAAGIIHRDVKPGNIMITLDGRAKVLDFGLAKLREVTGVVSEDSVTRLESTTPGAVVGTVPYMSPEQATGGEIDARSDVFSAGSVIYEMVSGRRPFPGATNTAIIRAILSEAQAPLTNLAPGVPKAISEIVDVCLRKDPAERYANASAVAKQLRAVQKSGFPAPVSDDITKTLEVPKPIWRRRGIAAFVTMGPLAVTAIFYWRGMPIVSFEQPALKELQESEALLRRYDRKGNVERAIALLETVRQNSASRASVLAALAECYVRKFNANGDKAILQTAIEHGEAAVKANGDLAAAHVAYGLALATGGNAAEAERRFERARELNPLSGRAHLGLAKLKSGDEAERLFRKAMDLSPGDWVPLHEWAVYCIRQARYDDAIAAWKLAVAATPDNLTVMSYLGGGYNMKSQYDEAADTFQRVLALDATVAAAWANLATARFFQRKYLDAVRAAEKATELAPDRFLYWGNLGDNYRWASMPDKAGGAYEKAIRLVKERLKANPADTTTRASLAVYYAKSGAIPAALDEIRQLDLTARNDIRVQFRAAIVFELAREREKALDYLRRAAGAGYSMHEIANEPELAALRNDPRYSAIANRKGVPTSK